MGTKKLGGRTPQFRPHLALYAAAALLLLSACAPKGVYMTGGNDLDSKFKKGKVTVAVLPFVDQLEPSGFCGGYGMYGCGILGGVTNSYEDFDRVATNAVVASLWKKNKLRLVRHDKMVEAVKGAHLTANRVFPKAEYTNPTFCGNLPKPIESTNDTGLGATPDYAALYKIGEAAGADILIIGRVNRDEIATPCSTNFFGAVPPYTTVLSAIDIGYRAYMYKDEFVSLDIMALDIKKHEVIAFGGYQMLNERLKSGQQKALDQVADGVTFYAPIPATSDLEKQFLAESGSVLATVIANYVLDEVGIHWRMDFNFEYTFGDEAWKSYPPDYFDKNFAYHTKDFPWPQ